MNNTEKRLSIEEIEKAYPEAYKWAREFHDLYEETAPMFGYETRKETKEFDPTSPNGRLMTYVCFNLIQQAVAEERESVGICIEERKKEAREILEKSNKNFSAMGAIAVLEDLLASLDKPLTAKE